MISKESSHTQCILIFGLMKASSIHIHRFSSGLCVANNFGCFSDVNAELTPQDLAGFSCDPTQGDKSLMFTRRIVDVDFYQIQICPFYLNSALPSQAKYQWTTNLLGSAANFVKSVSVNAVRLVAERDYTEIDAFALFDKVLLHEVSRSTLHYVNQCYHRTNDLWSS